MRDPFRPNSNNQLVREAQFAFVVIVVLLGVLVYVALHRMTSRKFRFNRIAQTAPLAQHINDNAYPAQAIRDQERHITQKLSTMAQRIAPPESNRSNPTSPTAKPTATQTFLPRQQPAPSAPTKPPLAQATAPLMPSPSVAQAQFIEPPKPKSAFDFAPRRDLSISKQPKPTVDDPIKQINSSSFKPTKASSVREKQSGRNNGFGYSNPSERDASAAENPTVDFRPPQIKSNFGAGSIRALPSFDSPTQKELTQETPAKTPSRPTPLETLAKANEPTVSSFVPPRKTSPAFDPSFKAKKIPETKVTKVAKLPQKQIPKPQLPSLGPQEYRVQPTDSLWSIASDHYGDGRFFRALHAHNLGRITSADRLEPNTTLVIPAVGELISRYAKLCPADKLSVPKLASVGYRESNASETNYDLYQERMDARFYITRSGDTLFDVARQRLGQASRYLEIFELNRFRIPEHANHLTPLDPGLRLLLPE